MKEANQPMIENMVVPSRKALIKEERPTLLCTVRRKKAVAKEKITLKSGMQKTSDE